MRAPRVSVQERRWVLGFALVAMVVVSLPYLIGYAVQGDEWVFTGFVFGVEDGNSYLAKMMRGYAGDWLFRTSYTTHPQSGLLVLFPYLLLGKLTAPPGQHVQMVALFHLFRFAAGVLVFLATYDFLALFIRKVSLRRWGLALGTMGGGLGWVFVLLGQTDWLGSLPLDFYSPESFGFLALYGLPHVALGRALLLWGMTAYLAIESSPRGGLHAGVFWLGLGLMQPITVLIAWVVVGAYVVVLGFCQLWQQRRGRATHWARWKEYLQRALVAILLSSPLVIYTTVVFLGDPFAQAWSAQNLLPSPHPLHYLLAYGLMLPFAIVGARRVLRDGSWKAWLPVAWVLIAPILVYAPVSVQRRLAEGVWVVIVLLAINSLDREKVPRGITLDPVVFLLAFPTSLILLAGGLLAAWRPAKPLFRPVDEVAAIRFLDTVAEKDAIVLAAYESSNVLPVWAPVRVVIGHGPESINLEKIRPRVEATFQENVGDEARLAFLEEYDVQYLFWGPNERQLGDWNPNGTEYLSLIYQEEGYYLFEVSSPDYND